jgi:hypothetical protein
MKLAGCLRRFRQSYLCLTVTGHCFSNSDLANRAQTSGECPARWFDRVDLRCWAMAAPGCDEEAAIHDVSAK